MIFTNHRGKLKIPPTLYHDREARLAKFIELKAPPVIVKHAAQLLVASFKWSWRGLAVDLWLWAQYNPAGWWVRWLLSRKFRRETNAAGLEMMDALSSGDVIGDKDPEDCTTDAPRYEVPPNQRRRFLEPWSVWKRRVKGGAQ